ncbi:MAG: FAD-dependent oxidoreductase, partial [Oscillospiraceae bacterium]|nr:FAD-dependent oxidoreductase [Oscillospiraceae bacterium]
MLVVGGGPAGLTAALYGARAGLSVTVLERQFCGGQMTTTGDIENYPGLEAISGPDLSMRMEAQARKQGVSFLSR